VLLQLPLALAVAHNTGAALLLCATLAATFRVFQRSEARQPYRRGLHKTFPGGPLNGRPKGGRGY
jgi:cytochrome c oxidase assembly protein subunit 15